MHNLTYLHRFEQFHLHSFLLEHIVAWPPLGYIISGLGVAIDGEPFLFIAAYMAYQEYLNLFIAVAVVYGMTLTGDLCFYLIGKQLHRFPKVVHVWAERIAEPFDQMMIAHPARLFILSKFAYGIHHALWARAGSLNLPLRRLVQIDLVATALWILVIGGITYTFGAAFQNVTRYLGYVEITLLLGLIIFLYAQQKVGKWIAARLKKKELPKVRSGGA